MHRVPPSVRFAVIFLIAFVLRMVYCSLSVGFGRFSREEYSEYVVAAERLLEYGTLVSPLITTDMSREPSALMPPAYVALVAGVYWLLGTGTFAATLVLQVINATATSLATILVFSVARRLAGTSAAWVAAAIAAINPTLIGFTTYMWDTSLLCFGVVLSVWISLHLSEGSNRPWGWLAYGLFLGGLALLNPALTVAYPFLVLWPIVRWHGWRFRAMLRGTLLSVCGWLIAIVPWTARNYVHFDELMYIRGGFWLELWLGVCPEADAHGKAVYRSQFPLSSDEAQRRISSMGELAYIEECGQRARAAIAADPRRMVRLVATRVVDYYLGTVYSHAPPGGGGWPESLHRRAIMIFLATEVFAVVGCLVILRTRTRRGALWLLAIIMSFSIVYCLTHVQVRFRTSTEPLTAVLVAMLLVGVCGVGRARGGTPRPDDAG